MILVRKKSRWFNTSEIMVSRRIFGGLNPHNLLILQKVWQKELKSLSSHCSLMGVEKNKIILKPSNSVIANEILIRKDEILRDLNKYFKSKWIKDIRIE